MNLPDWNRLGHPEPAQACRRSPATIAADGDEDRRRHAAVEPPGEQRPDGARQRGDEVDDDGDGRDQQVEQELVAGLVRVERVGEDAPLRHEHVRREHRTEDQREARPVMFMNGVSSRSCGGNSVATGTPVAGSSA